MRHIKVFVFIFLSLSISANAADTAAEAHPSVLITFDPGSARISDSDKDAIRTAVRDVRKNFPIDHISVAAWSDKALPPQGKLKETETGLAEERLHTIHDFLEREMELGSIDLFNMAESANWVTRTFRTKDAELKSIFTRAEGASASRSEFRAIRLRGAPYKAVIVVVRKVE